MARGGATIFPELGIRVTPLKGAAIYWSNLNGAGELDTKTLHAGCPVLLGSKWGMNLGLNINNNIINSTMNTFKSSVYIFFYLFCFVLLTR